MARTWRILMQLSVCLPLSSTQRDFEDFTAELFLSRSELDSGLYEGQVRGRRLFGSSQVPQGRGTIFFFTNDRFNRHNYTGDWVNGTREGNGTTYFKDGSVYTGEYKNSLETGSGRIDYPNGNRLEAEFLDGRIEGHGVFRYANGDQREGFFSDSILDGQVIFTRNDGVTLIEKWENGSRLVNEDQLVQDGANIADNTAENSGKISENLPNKTKEENEESGINLELLRKAIRSGDRFALFGSARDPKTSNLNGLTSARDIARSNQSSFLREIFDSVN